MTSVERARLLARAQKTANFPRLESRRSCSEGLAALGWWMVVLSCAAGYLMIVIWLWHHFPGLAIAMTVGLVGFLVVILGHMLEHFSR